MKPILKLSMSSLICLAAVTVATASDFNLKDVNDLYKDVHVKVVFNPNIESQYRAFIKERFLDRETLEEKISSIKTQRSQTEGLLDRGVLSLMKGIALKKLADMLKKNVRVEERRGALLNAKRLLANVSCLDDQKENTLFYKLAHANTLKALESTSTDDKERLDYVKALRQAVVALDKGHPADTLRKGGKLYSDLAYITGEGGINLEEVIAVEPKLVLLSIENRQSFIENVIAMSKGEAGDGQPFVHVRQIAPWVAPQLTLNLRPMMPLPKDLGTMRQGVECTFNNKRPMTFALSTEYPLQHARWEYHEDRKNHKDQITLHLTALINNQSKEVLQVYSIPHNLVASKPAGAGWNIFDGDNKAYQTYLQRHLWQTQGGQQYNYTKEIKGNAIGSHQGHQVIFVEPFEMGGKPSKPKQTYRGKYNFARNLTENEKLPGRTPENMIYSDGLHIYKPHITQELWQQAFSQGLSDPVVGFFIASYREEGRLQFNPLDGSFPKGLYQLHSLTNRPIVRIEKWKKLGEEEKTIAITTPIGVPSIAH